MKRLFTIFFALLLGITAAFAQTQPTLPYQAVVRDNQNHLLKDADVSIDVQIYEGATLRYSETQTPHSNANGLISFNIGAGSGATGTMADVADWRVAKFKFTYHLTDGDVVVTDSVHAVPYALQTAFATGGNFLTSDSAVITTMQGNIATNTTNITTNTTDIAALANRVNTFNTNVCDSVATCVGNAIDARGFLTSDSAVITTMQGNITTNTTNIATNTDNIAALANRVNTFNTNVCDSVKNCDFSGNASIQNMLQELSDLISAQNHKIDSLAHLVDSLSNLPHGNTPAATFTCGTDSIKDVDNNWYHTVKIGEQCWTKENLRTTKKPNNEAITDGMWEPGTNSVETYGRLYSWTTMMNGESSSEANPSGVQGICPDGWHVPSDAEWTQLTDYVNTEANGYRCDGDGTIANALSSSTGWQSPSDCGAGHNSTTLNATGFSAVPAGYCFGGSFYDFGGLAYFWSATENEDFSAWRRDLIFLVSNVIRNNANKDYGYSVRCVRNAETGGGDTPDTPAETTLTLTTDKSSATVKLCGADSVSVTYTATVENGSATEYTWTTSGGTPTESTTNTYTVNYTTTGTYTVTCTAAGITATESVEIASGGTAPTLSLCEDCSTGSITVKTSTNVASIVWRNEANDSVSNSTTELTQSATIPAGNYSATAASSDGCTVTRTATLGNATSHPCTVASFRGNESGTGTQLDSVHDHQDNWYRVVEINGQCWLAENMRCTTSPRQGTVDLQSGGTSGTDEDNPKYYDYNSTDQVVTNSRARGLLYNWVAAMDTMYTSLTQPFAVDFPNRRGICPEGWHLPTDDEWFMLEKNVLTNAAWAAVTSASNSGTSYRGTGAGKLTGGCVWNSSTNTTAPGNYSYADRNNTGFSALPVGFTNGSFGYSGFNAHFWSATSGSTLNAWTRTFTNPGEGGARVIYSKYYGFSVRCLRDAEPEATLTLTTDKSSGTVKLCGAASVSVTYTATVENGSATEYTWTTSGGTPTASTTNTYTVNYTTTGTYTVNCTAAGITATNSVEIASGGTAPALGLCEDCNTGSITVKTSTNVASIVWRNADGDSVSNSTTELTLSATIPAGNYSATAASSDGCTVTRTATLGNATSHPCTVASIRSNERGMGTQLDSVSDHEGNWYRVVEINGQCWLAENMRCTTSPRQGTVNLQPGSSTDYDNPMYYDYNSTVSTSYPQVVTNSRSRGLLYNWVAAMDTMYTSTTRPSTVNFPNRRGICPEGWHLPTDDEWFMLEKNVLTSTSWDNVTSASNSGAGYRGTGAGKLTGGCVWESSTKTTAPGNYSYADRNNTGFSALPVGNYHGSFYISGIGAGFWSATSSNPDDAWPRNFFDYIGVGRNLTEKYYGYSVRCVRN